MTESMAVLAILFVAAVALGVRGPRWARLLTAASIFVFQAFVLVISFDAAARSVIAERTQTGTLSPEFVDGVRSLKSALLPYRLMLFVSGCGLLVLLTLPLSKKKQGESEKTKVPGTK